VIASMNGDGSSSGRYPAGAVDYAIQGLFLLIGPALYFAENAVQILVPLLAVALAIACRPSWKNELRPFVGRYGVVIAFGALGVASALWSVDPSRSLMRGARLTGEIAIGLGFLAVMQSIGARRRQDAMGMLALGFIAAVAAVLVSFLWLLAFGEGMSLAALHAWSVPFSQGASIHAILVVPLVLALARRRAFPAAWLFVAASLPTFALIDTNAARGAIVIGAAVGALAYLKAAVRYGAYALILIATLALPLLFPVSLGPSLGCTLYRTSPSAAHRLAIWNAVAESIAERPWLGWGLDGSRELSQRQATFDLAASCAGDDVPPRPAQRLPRHPHNAVLQVWLELGLVGAGLAAAIWALIFLRTEATLPGRLARAGFAGGIAALVTVLALSYGILQGWLVFSLFVVAATFMAFLRLEAAR